MSLQTLQSILQQQVSSSGTIVVSEATLHAANLVPIPNFDTIIQSYLNLTGPLSVVVTAQIPAPNGNQLAIAGIASFLGITTAVSTQIVFMLEDNTVNALVVAALSDNWNFSASFPLLVGFPFA